MLRTTLAGLRLYKGRLVTTALAIVLGVAFIAGTLVFTDTLTESYSATAMGSADKIDAIALPAGTPEDAAVPESGETVPAGLQARIRALPEVATATGIVRGTAPLLDKDGRAVGMAPTLGV